MNASPLKTVHDGQPILAIDHEKIPQQLKDRRQWVLWSLVVRDGKETKVPFQVNGEPAKSNDPSTWNDFDTVLAAYNRGGFSGIGYMFSADDPYCGADLDGCRNKDTGQVADWAREVILKFGSYAEVSPSGTGVKIFCIASNDGSGRKVMIETEKIGDKQPAIEIYDRLRYFAVTGLQLQGMNTLANCQEAVAWLKAKYFTPLAQPGDAYEGPVPFASDLAVFERCSKYIGKLPGAISGQGGHNATFRAACIAVKGFGLSEAEAMDVMHQFNTRCEPAWTEKELQHKVKSAANQPGEVGYLRDVSPTRWNTVRVPPYQEPSREPEAWPEPQPIPNDLPPVQPFDYAMLPDAFVPYVGDVAERMQCPPDFPAVATMVAFAGVAGKKIGIRPKRHDDWLVVPNLWGGVIGRPGIMKTPAIRQPFKFLQRLEIEAKKEYSKECAAHEVKVLVAEEQKKKRKAAIAEAIKQGQDPEQAAQEIVIEMPKEPIARRYIVNDSTVEKLGDLLNKNPNGLTVFRDEITGFLEHLDREGQEGARAFYIEAWDGLGKFVYDRITRGTLEIESVTVSIFGGIQPGRLASYLRAAVQGGAGDDGLMQRFQMSVYPDINMQWRNIDRWPDTGAKQQVWNVFQAMNTLDPASVGAELDDDAPFLRFDHDAQILFDDWRTQLELRLRSGDEHPAIESHLAKYRSLVPSLALLIHLADGGKGPVTAVPTRKALAWARYLESHARRIYAIVTDPVTAAAKALARRIMKGDVRDGFNLRSVYHNGWAGLDKQASEFAVELLIELGWLKEVEIPTRGRPKTAYQINPAILSKARGNGTDKTDKSPLADPSGSNGSDLPGHSEEEEWGVV